MNLGFYVESNGGTPQNTQIFNFLNSGLSSGDISDGSVFFNNVNFCPITPKFGMYNSTELWSFTGRLITTSIQNTKRAMATVNKFKLAYLFSAGDDVRQGLFQLCDLSQKVPVITTCEEDRKEFYRLTGIKSNFVEELSVKAIKGVYNE